MAEISLHYFAPVEQPESLKPLLILLHGGALSHRMYHTIIPILIARGFEVIAPDLPGHGSSLRTGPFTFKSATHLLCSSIQKLKKGQQQKTLIVGVSLGGQVILDLLQHHADIADAAIVSGASIHPPDENTHWEMPHMPTDQKWLTLMTEDVNVMGIENAQGVQQESFAFAFSPSGILPPVLVVVGENDVSMAKRDFEELAILATGGNGRSESRVLEGAWHNHPIDIPQRFATLIEEWAAKVL